MLLLRQDTMKLSVFVIDKINVRSIEAVNKLVNKKQRRKKLNHDNRKGSYR